ncbi:MAG: Ig-like domain-containing protein [Clostridia bacterium]|nr:Ig-like domain-containing protein [Clostridia bacterium]
MKKFLIGVIFLIPIVVVIALSATGAIISLTTPVNPSDMVIKNSDNEEIDRNAIIKIDSRNFDEFIIIDVLPAITQDKAITYERVDEAGNGEIELEQIGDSNRYSIIPKKIGVTKLEIRAKANVNVYREVTFYVSSDSIETMTIYDQNGLDVGEHRQMSATERLYVDINPFDAVRNNDIHWTSSNTSVAKVSPNGTVTVTGRGLARIKVTAVDKDGNTVSDYVDVDTADAVVTKTKVYVENAVDSDWVMANCVLDLEATINDLGDGSFEVVSDNGVYTIETIVADENDWALVDLPSVMYLRNGGYVPLVIKLLADEAIEDYEISFSDASILEYEKETGLILPLAPGTATVNVTYNGETKSHEVVVRDNPLAFELELGTADQKLGIQLDRTYGLYWLDENYNLTTQYRFGLANKDNTFDVAWSVNDSNFADITRVGEGQDIIINFKEAAQGQNVVITATLKINELVQQRVKRSFTFKIREQKNSINVYTFEQAKWIRDFHFYNIVLQSDIVAPERIEDLSASVYGNGFKWDGTNIPETDMDFEDGAIEYDYEDFIGASRDGRYQPNYDLFVAEGNDKIVFEDMMMFNANSIEEADNRGSGIKSEALWHETRDCFKDYPEKEIPVYFRYLQIYNTHRGIQIGYHYDVTIEGCILGDNAEDCVFAYYYNEKSKRSKEDNKLTFRNNVFKISSGPSVMVASVPIDFDIDSNSNSAPALKFEGFNDIYNWKTKDEFVQSVVDLIGGYVGMFASGSLKDAIDSLLMPILDKVILDISNGDAIQDLYYNYAGEKYVSFGVLGLGALFKFDSSKVTVESDNLMLTDLPFTDSQGKPVGRMAGLESLIKTLAPEVGMPNATTLCNPSAIVCTNFSQGDPDIKPGDPIPNSIELYEKLRGN